MATYKAHPFYLVESGDVRINFDHCGDYETVDAAEIALIDALCPTWITRIDSPEEKPAPKAPARRANSSAK